MRRCGSVQATDRHRRCDRVKRLPAALTVPVEGLPAPHRPDWLTMTNFPISRLRSIPSACAEVLRRWPPRRDPSLPPLQLSRLASSSSSSNLEASVSSARSLSQCKAAARGLNLAANERNRNFFSSEFQYVSCLQLRHRSFLQMCHWPFFQN